MTIYLAIMLVVDDSCSSDEVHVLVRAFTCRKQAQIVCARTGARYAEIVVEDERSVVEDVKTYPNSHRRRASRI